MWQTMAPPEPKPSRPAVPRNDASKPPATLPAAIAAAAAETAQAKAKKLGLTKASTPGNTSTESQASQKQAPQNAVAITYQSSDGAPKIVAKGRGLVAQQIIERAKEHGVFVHESKELVALLMQVELDDHIPPALYRAVAELLAWLYHIEAAHHSAGKV
jgi:flagellar biosynthesis protein